MLVFATRHVAVRQVQELGPWASAVLDEIKQLFKIQRLLRINDHSDVKLGKSGICILDCCALHTTGKIGKGLMGSLWEETFSFIALSWDTEVHMQLPR